VYSGVNLGEDTVARFADAGGQWVAPVVYGDEVAGPWNSANLDGLRTMCGRHGVAVHGWFNYFGTDPAVFAGDVAAIVAAKNLELAILDCEASVQGSTLMSQVALAVRQRLPKTLLGITTNSLNDSVVWNGRLDGVPQPAWKSVRRLGYRLIPQWYNAPRYGGRSNKWTCADLNMEWLKGPGGTTDNLRDESYANKRAVALSYVHGATSATGVEGADLAGELVEFAAAKKHGYTGGLIYYTLEREPGTNDMALLQAVRGTVYV
jgi:hypothetical protein